MAKPSILESLHTSVKIWHGKVKCEITLTPLCLRQWSFQEGPRLVMNDSFVNTAPMCDSRIRGADVNIYEAKVRA